VEGPSLAATKVIGRLRVWILVIGYATDSADLIADEGTKPALSGRIRNGDGAPFPGGNGAPSLEVQTACRRPLWRPEAEEKG